jgi:hypothetical protein
MIDVQVHYKSSSSIRQRLAAVPRPGDYLTHDGKVWRIDAVVHGTPTTTWGKGSIDVYCIEVDEIRTNELEAEWSAWTKQACKNE